MVESLGINDVLLIVILAVCLYTDIKERKIYNKIVVPAMLAGLIYFSLNSGLGGLITSLKGLFLGMGLLIIPFIMGGFGAGDVKLMGAIGALKGPLFIAKTFVFTGISGGVIAIGFLIYQRKLLTTIKRIVVSLSMLFGSRFKVNTLDNLDKSGYHEAFPYGLAIVAGTVAAYLVG